MQTRYDKGSVRYMQNMGRKALDQKREFRSGEDRTQKNEKSQVLKLFKVAAQSILPFGRIERCLQKIE